MEITMIAFNSDPVSVIVLVMNQDSIYRVLLYSAIHLIVKHFKWATPEKKLAKMTK